MDHRSGDDVLVDTGTREVDPGPDDLPGGSTAAPTPTRRGGWGAWVVLLAALVPLAVVAANSAALLSGALDDPYFLQYTSDENGNETIAVQDGVTFWSRWSMLWWTFPPGGGLLAGAVPVVLVAVLHHVRGPGWLVPGRVARRTGAALSGLTAVLGASTLVVALAAASRPVDREGSDWYRSGSILFDVGRLGVEVVVATALAALATAALLRPATEGDVDRVEARSFESGDTERAHVEGGVRPDPRPQPVVGTTPDGSPEQAAPDTTPAPPVVVSFPRPLDPSLYRRPST